MERITQKTLQFVVDRLNRIAGFEDKQLWSKDEDGRYNATIGMFYISGAYGGVALHRMVTAGGGVSDVFSSGHMNKRDLYNRTLAYIRALESVRHGEVAIKGSV